MTWVTEAFRLERESNRDCSRGHQEHWVVVQRNGNASAFSGYHWTPSDYSGIRCLKCNRYWRTKANYVRHLPDASTVAEKDKYP